MIEFGAAGLAVGWVAARRRPWSIALVGSSLGGLTIWILSCRFAAEAWADALAFWIAAQLAWFLTQVTAPARAERRRIVDDARPFG
jgi:hypothetical protein